PLSFVLSATDAEGDLLTYAVVAAPAKGSLTLNGANATYTPNANVNGVDTFTFRANDGQLNSNFATVTITINPVNDPPVAQNGAAITNEDTPVNIQLQASDIDSVTLTYAIVVAPTKGVVVLNGDLATYTPNPDANGVDSFTFKANDGMLDS